jgi:hypothetical protein
MNDDKPTRQDYRNSIETMADVIEDEYDMGYDELSEMVWENVDSSSWVIYTDKNILALEYGNNQPEEWKHLVGDNSSWQEVVQAMAFRVVEQDLYDELQRRDVV